MIINIGTTNNAKIQAVKDTILTYEGFKDAQFVSKKVSSEVSDQPLSLEETARGAQNRARNSFDNCKYSIGLEAGLIAVPGTRSGYMNVGVCVIYDGTQFFTGLTPGFEYPPHVTRNVAQGTSEIKHAMVDAGISSDPSISTGQGNVGILTSGRINRSSYVSQSIIMAMIQLEHKKYYE